MGTCTTPSRSAVVALVNTTPTIITTTTDSICDSGTATLGATASAGTINWYANSTGGLSIAMGNSFITPVISVTDTLYVDATVGACTTPSRSAVVALVSVTPIINNIANLILCNNASSSIITFSGGVAVTTYNWTNDNLLIGLGADGNGNIPSFTSINTGTEASIATIIVTPITNGCIGISDSFTINVNPTPIALANSNSSICINHPINLIAQTVVGGSYLWTNTNGYSSTSQNPIIPSASLSDAGEYSLIVSLNDCPSDVSLVTIVIDDCPDFNIPEGFSPNGDAINDVFVIRGIINYPNNTFLIFNRWGSKVFEASPYQNTWDGTSTIGVKVGGNELPVSTYFYLLDLGDGTNVIKGTIYLNR
ncbi:MAG: hypothetical protein A2X12_06995 [Bacteroidetes bacterium GWE2_29_8]|nr:MAG: hypothetical protein A2X12_06995 [Bacteroidetes bacterium GWE2_29_8]